MIPITYLKNTSSVNIHSYANRGMELENDINYTNNYYIKNNIALIYKKPTPIKVVNVSYPKNIIKEAYFSEPSTLDYVGIYNGKYIEFDAKETKNKNSFPLSNIHKHQLEHIKKVNDYRGIAFLIIRFTSLNETYLLLGSDLINFIKNNTRKSIPINYLRDYAYLIKLKYNIRVDYISIISKIIKDKEVDNYEN